jgi:hypothetical protein
MRLKSALVALLSVLAVACFVLASMTSSQEQKNAKQLPKDGKEVKEVELSELKLSEKQKKHRKLMKVTAGPKLSDLAAKATGDVVVAVEEPLKISTTDEEVTQTPSLQFTVCNPEVIVVGELKSESPQLTEDESFLFTEYQMVVEEVLKNNPLSPARPGASLTVIREGGTGKVNGKTVRAVREGFRPFRVGQRYVLFLRYIPETGAYSAYPYGSFKLAAGKVLPHGEMPRGVTADESGFLEEVRTIVNAGGCGSRQ